MRPVCVVLWIIVGILILLLLWLLKVKYGEKLTEDGPF
jgi:hypothetical protein